VSPPTRILVDQDGFIVADKPPGVPALRERGFGDSLADQVARELGVQAAALHAENRLDVGVSGTVIFSRRGGSAKRKPPAFERRYIGIAGVAPSPAEGSWSHPIGRGPRGSWVVGGRDARIARTRYRVVAGGPVSARVPGGAALTPALVAFELDTGRTHQIRVHATHAGAPLLGDARYGGARRFATEQGSVYEFPRIALHAARVEIALARGVLRVDAPVPSDLLSLWAAFGGEARDFETALSIEVPARAE
jgi:23S rRNA-/tRNA-specific pseudouridylate synthase